MSMKPIPTWVLVLCFILDISFSFSEEIYRWTDEKGTVHFTDDASRIPEKYRGEAEETKVIGEMAKEDGEIREPGESREKSDRVRKYLEKMDRKIEAKKKMEREISELEEERRLLEERLKWIEDYERENYYYYIPYRDRKTGKLVPVASPYYDEKVKLTQRIESIKSEIKALQEKLSTIRKSLQ